MTFNGRTATTLVMFLIFAGACLLALELPQKAAFMPLLIGIPGALLCAAQLLVDLRAGADEAAAEPKEDAEDARSEVEIFIWLGLFSFVLLGFGFVVGGPVIVGAFVKFSSRDTWQNALFAAGGTFAVLYGVFIWLLELSLFQGLILEAILP